MSYVSDQEVRVRDLRKEVSERNKTTKCDRCGASWETPKSRKWLANTHYQHPACAAEWLTKQLRETNWVTTSSGAWVHKVMQAAGILARVEPTDFRKGKRKGKRHQPQRVENEIWIPRWISALLDGGWKLWEDYDSDQAVELYGAFLAEVNADKEKRESAFAAMRMSGPTAIRGFVITPRVRAIALRKKAKGLIDQACALEAQANELDPPEAYRHVG